MLPLSRLGALLPLPLLIVAAAVRTSPAAEPPVLLAPVKASAVEGSVVKIFSTSRYPDPYKPWTKQGPRDSTGTGVIIEGRRILTNAHVVLYASQVQVQANQSGDKIRATVESIAQGIDLAVLKLEDESFFDNRPPLPRATKLPAVKDSVMVYGFPAGGTTLSITKGIVSRIEFAGYGMSTAGLRIQIDAAINPGNSGGPAVDGDKMIGLAFSRLGGGDNIGYIIPCEEVELFLADVRDGKYDGKPAMWDSLQTFENAALRPFLKAPKGIDGMIVTETDSSDPNYPLKPWDIITEIGGVRVDNEGMVRVGDLRVRFQYIIQRAARDGRVPLKICRDGVERAIELPVTARRSMLIPDLDGAYPSYFVYGPLVFSAATQQFLGGLNNNSWAALAAIGNPLAVRRADRPAFPDEALVVVASPFFPHKLSQDYSPAQSRVVSRINNTEIKNLAHLVATLRDLKDEFVVLDFVGRRLENLVFPRKEMLAATEDILTDNGVRSQGSTDMMAVWNERKN
ncbi:MAG: trypsin-like peptidase domain-containing protein [Opitutaceae bacterium]|nr:trypsin-like peptidase domain-containing protein [Opitutaceae bacterium]